MEVEFLKGACDEEKDSSSDEQGAHSIEEVGTNLFDAFAIFTKKDDAEDEEDDDEKAVFEVVRSDLLDREGDVEVSDIDFP